MRTKNIIQMFLILFAVILAACARPKYYQITPSENSDQTGQYALDKANCNLKFQQLKFNNQDVCMSYSWQIESGEILKSNQYYSMIVKFFRANQFDQTPVTLDVQNLKFNVQLWMPSMNHGSVPTQIEYLDEGTYRVKNIYFIMSGDWQLRFQLKTDSTQDQITQNLVLEN